MADVGEGAARALDAPNVPSSVMAEAKKSEAELMEEEAQERTWRHAENAAAATLRILTACVK